MKQHRLGDCFRIKHGYAFKGEYFSDSGSYIVLTPGNFYEKGGFRLRPSKEKYYVGEIPNGYILKQGDLIVAMTEQAEGLLGSPAIIPENNVFLHNQRLGLVQDLDAAKLDKRFLYYLFNHADVRAQIRATANGAKVRHTSPSRIYDVVVSLPDLSTQERIASILSAYDDLFENNTRRIAVLEEVARALYQEWFVHFRFPGHEDVPLVDSPLGPIPEGWDVLPFSSVAQFINGFAFKPSHWGTRGLPIVKIKELKNGITSDTPRFEGQLPPKYHIKNGDVLFSWSADLDAYIWSHGDAWLNQHLFLVHPRPRLSKLFIFYALQNRMEQFRARSAGTTMRHIKRAALDQVMLTLPEAEVRERFEQNCQPMHDLVETLRAKNENLRATRDLLLPKLISGEIDVTALSEEPIPEAAD